MQTILYDPIDGAAISDGSVDEIVRGIILNDQEPRWIDHTRVFSTENVFHAIRLAIIEERLDYRRIQFQYRNGILPLDKWGQLTTGWPVGFADLNSRTIESILESMRLRNY